MILPRPLSGVPKEKGGTRFWLRAIHKKSTLVRSNTRDTLLQVSRLNHAFVNRKRIIAVIAAVVFAGVLAYGIGWHTYLGRAARGISTVAIRNDSDMPLKDVHVCLFDSRQTVINRHFDLIRPHQQVRVPVYTSDLYVQSVVGKHGNRKIAYDDVDIVTRGETLELVVDSSGTVSRTYAD